MSSHGQHTHRRCRFPLAFGVVGMVLCLAAMLPASLAAAQTFTTVSPPIVVPDGAPGIGDTITVAAVPGTIESLRVGVSITHGFVGDLSLYLVPPGVTWSGPYDASGVAATTGEIALSIVRGGSGNHYGPPPAYTSFARQGDPVHDPLSMAPPIAAGIAPFDGTFVPDGSVDFASLAGTTPNGDWVLVVFDDTSTDQGTLESWQIEFQPAPPGPEIAIYRPLWLEIADGGTALVGYTTVATTGSWTFTIANLGATNPLTVGAVIISGETNCTAAVTATPAGSVPPQSTTTFTVEATPQAVGYFWFDLDIANDDVDESLYDVLVSGNAGGVPPELLYYPFDEGAGDTTVNAAYPGIGTPIPQFIDGTNPLAPTWVLPGQVGAAAASGGGLAMLPTGLDPRGLNGSSFTIEFWLRTTDAAPANGYVFGDRHTTLDNFRCMVGFGSPLLWFRGGGLADLWSTTSINDLAWHHVAFVYDHFAQTTTLYIDGIPERQNVAQQALIVGRELVLFDNNLIAGNTLTHEVDDFRLFVGARSSGVIAAEASQGYVADIDIQRPTGASIASGAVDTLGNITQGIPAGFNYTLENVGNSTLDLTGTPLVDLQNQINCVASVLVQPALDPLPAGIAVPVVIQVTPNAGGGAFSFDIVVLSDDPDEPTYTIFAQGTGVAGFAEIDVQRPAGTSIASGTIDAVGDATRGIESAYTYTIENQGAADVNLLGSPLVATSGAVNCTVTVTQPPTNRLTPAQTTTFTIRVNPPVAGAFSVDITILNNDPDESTYTFTLSGNAVAPQPGSGGCNLAPAPGAPAARGHTLLLLLALLTLLFAATTRRTRPA